LQASDTTKYFIHAEFNADGVVERSDVVGAIYGQTEGLLGDELDLRDLQKSSKISRMEVGVESKGGSSHGTVTIGSSLDRVETSVLAASLETIERVGPCEASVEITGIEDVRTTKRKEIVDRAKTIHDELFDGSAMGTEEMLEIVRESVRKEDITEYEGFPAGPKVEESDAVLLVEGRADVLNLLKSGIKNAVGVEGTDVPEAVARLTEDRTVTAFLDSDRGADLILRELAQVADVDYVARPPEGKCVEDLSGSQINEALRNKHPYDTVLSEDGKLVTGQGDGEKDKKDTRVRSQKDSSVSTENGKNDEANDERKSAVSEQTITLRERLRSVGNGRAILLDSDTEEISRIQKGNLLPELHERNGEVKTVVLDGELSQATVDAASSEGVDTVVGDSIGNIAKEPFDVNLVTLTELP